MIDKICSRIMDCEWCERHRFTESNNCISIRKMLSDEEQRALKESIDRRKWSCRNYIAECAKCRSVKR